MAAKLQRLRHPPQFVVHCTGIAGAVAGILSPVAFGWILDLTGSWTMPFVASMGLMLVGSVSAFWIRPDETLGAAAPAGKLALAAH